MPGATLAEFLNYARANPAKLNYATGGAFSIISTPQLMKSAGVDMVHVPYKGDPAALVDLVAGRVQFMFVTQTAGVPFVRDGRVRALAVTNSKRSLLAPEVPTLAEAGFPGLLHLSWAGIIGPAKMRTDVVERLNKELTATLSRPKFQEDLIRQGFEPAGSSPDELRAFIKEQLEAWTRYVRELGLQTE
jgi:tripartite-type tricarboxylate transporter receptor subunit TctC